MSVGKGSLQRAAKANDVKAAETVKEVTKTAVKEIAKAPAKPAAKKTTTAKKAAVATKAPAAKKAPAKKTTEKKTPVVAASVISPDSIHEMKFQAASRIYCELPTYLL